MIVYSPGVMPEIVKDPSGLSMVCDGGPIMNAPSRRGRAMTIPPGPVCGWPLAVERDAGHARGRCQRELDLEVADRLCETQGNALGRGGIRRYPG